MIPHLFRLELRLAARERSTRILLFLFAGVLLYGLLSGSGPARRHDAAGAKLTQASAEWMGLLRDHLKREPVDPRAVASQGSVAVLPPAPLPALAVGLSDLAPGHESFVLWRLDSPAGTPDELENPSLLLAGRFDLAFVLVWLYPLFLLALVYDLSAGDRETGTLRMALAQGIVPWRWVARRALARALPVLALALLSVLASGLGAGGDGVPARLALALAVTAAYGLFWTSLAAAVNSVARQAAGAAMTLGAAWVLLVLVAPTLLNVAVESFHPTPSRPELAAASRKAQGDAEKRGGEILTSFYQHHPELAPPGEQADLARITLTVQDEAARAVAPVRERFERQLARQQAAVGRWRFLSPAIAAHEALTDLAGTGYWRHREFREQVGGFKRAVAAYFAPKIHRGEAFTSADYDRMPRFVFREEPAGAWLARVIAGLAGILASGVALGAWAWWRLRPVRLNALAE